MRERTFILADVTLGDGGKGDITDFIVRQSPLQREGCAKPRKVIRYNGGSQALHHVVSPEGIKHGFAQIGSGSMVRGAQTYLSRFMAIDPFELVGEVAVLDRKGIRDIASRLSIDGACPVITDLNILLNRMLETSRGEKRHGSCGKGVGITLADRDKYGDDVLLTRDLADTSLTKTKLERTKALRLSEAEALCDINPNENRLREYLELIRGINIGYYADYYRNFACTFRIGSEEDISDWSGAVFEGAQGALLDANYGFLPYVTQSDTTVKQAETLITENNLSDFITRIGILRAYATRHGAGPLVTEDPELTSMVPPCDNGTNKWQGAFRIGWLDLVSTRYGIAMNRQIDCLALTNLDRLSEVGEVKVCLSYFYPGEDIDILQRYFYFEKMPGQGYKIIGLRSPRNLVITDESLVRITRVMQESRPLDFKTFDGWNIDRSRVSSFLDLPAGAKEFITFLGSTEGLGKPIAIVSFGPGANNKINMLQEQFNP